MWDVSNHALALEIMFLVNWFYFNFAVWHSYRYRDVCMCSYITNFFETLQITHNIKGNTEVPRILPIAIISKKV